MKQFKQIESLEFEANLSVVSSLTIFRMVLQEDHTVTELIETLQKKPAKIREVFDRLMLLMEKESNPILLHPHDIAISTYLYVLSAVDIAVASTLAIKVLDAPNLWWSKRLALGFQATMTPATESSMMLTSPEDIQIDRRPIDITFSSVVEDEINLWSIEDFEAQIDEDAAVWEALNTQGSIQYEGRSFTDQINFEQGGINTIVDFTIRISSQAEIAHGEFVIRQERVS
jgi:hypothetical protein